MRRTRRRQGRIPLAAGVVLSLLAVLALAVHFHETHSRELCCTCHGHHHHHHAGLPVVVGLLVDQGPQPLELRSTALAGVIAPDPLTSLSFRGPPVV